MYLIDTKFETFFFNLDLIPGTINGVLRYDVKKSSNLLFISTYGKNVKRGTWNTKLFIFEFSANKQYDVFRKDKISLIV